MEWEGERMQTQFELLAEQALQLASGEREAFVQLLIASLDTDHATDDALVAAVERRIADVDNGATQVIPMDEALASVRNRLK
jgi:putative addiction module component (TIGR02574 family)